MKTEEKLVQRIRQMGFPEAFGVEIAKQLKTENAMNRMMGYLSHISSPFSAEELVDEMLAICAERDIWINKKKSEYYNAKYNAYLFAKKRGL